MYIEFYIIPVISSPNYFIFITKRLGIKFAMQFEVCIVFALKNLLFNENILLFDEKFCRRPK